MQMDWNDAEGEDFHFELLREIASSEIEDFLSAEQEWLDFFWPTGQVYNQIKVARSYPVSGSSGRPFNSITSAKNQKITLSLAGEPLNLLRSMRECNSLKMSEAANYIFSRVIEGDTMSLLAIAKAYSARRQF